MGAMSHPACLVLPHGRCRWQLAGVCHAAALLANTGAVAGEAGVKDDAAEFSSGVPSPRTELLIAADKCVAFLRTRSPPPWFSTARCEGRVLREGCCVCLCTPRA